VRHSLRLGWCVVVLALAGCVGLSETKNYCCVDSASCSEIVVCDKDPSRTICDMAGDHGPGHTCIGSGQLPDADPGCDLPAECSAPTPVCRVSDRTCVECLESTSCTTAGEPVCGDDNVCRGCTLDDECAELAGRTECKEATGACVECTESAQCGAATPVCDSATDACRTCRADAECSTGVCNIDVGTCVPEADVLYVQLDADSGNVTCTRTAPCSSITKAVTAATTTRKWILVAASGTSYQDAVDLSGTRAKEVVIKGAGATVDATPDDVPAFNLGTLVAVAANVRIEGLTITGGFDSTDADGVFCAGSGTAKPVLSLIGVTVRNNSGSGIDATNCTVSMRASIVSGNTGGLSLDTSNFDITNNFIYGNNAGGGNFGGVKIDTLPGTPTQTRFQFNTVVDNTGGAGTIPQLRCDTGATELFLDNNIVSGDPLDGKQQFLGGQCKLRYSLVWKTAPPDGEVDVPTTLRNMDPVFVGTGDKPVPFYRLGPGSPARNTGNPTPLPDAPSTDFDGDPRVRNGRADMGADEAE
jgi:hypothetical protein